MKTVREILQSKGYEYWCVTPDTPVFDAIKMMADKNVGALPVFEADQLVGVISERDYARKIVLKQLTSKDTPVREIMSKEVIHVSPEQTTDECMALMTDHHVRHLPVLEGKKLIGVISIGDVIKAVRANPL
ncbi:MAG: CBS domain-containing protein [Acidiferrobacterales bacterium]